MGELLAVNISKGGIPKLPIERGDVTEAGLVGDGQAHAKHSKLSRALSILDIAEIDWLKSKGYAVGPGALGENLTVRHVIAEDVQIGTRLLFSGGVEIEVTEIRKPCFVLDSVDITLKEVSVGRIGWMARVVKTGRLTPGEGITVVAPEAEGGREGR